MNIALDFAAVLGEWPLLLRGIGWTLLLTAVAVVFGGVIGAACAWARTYGPRPLAWLVASYVELVRNTPFIIQLFFIFFGLPSLGLKLSPESASLIAMTFNLGAYSTEIIRAGLDATPRGQYDAAKALGLGRWLMFRRVVLPPALAKVWPAIVSQIIIVMLGSAVCGQIATHELSFAANLIQSRNFRAFESFIVVAVIYLALAVLLRQTLSWIGPRFLFGHFGKHR